MQSINHLSKTLTSRLNFSNLLIFSGVVLVIVSFAPFFYDELVYRLIQFKNQKFTLKQTDETVKDSPFARLLSTRPIFIEPVNKDFSLVIEKIGVNAPIVADVPITDDKAYFDALKNGIAHASTADYPSEQPGNVYLFAHASLNFWQIGKYSTVFNLVRKLEVGDRVDVFYEGRDYVYEVVNKETYRGFDIYPITRKVIEPIITLQTCDPPGTTLNRMVVTAKLKEVLD